MPGYCWAQNVMEPYRELWFVSHQIKFLLLSPSSVVSQHSAEQCVYPSRFCAFNGETSYSEHFCQPCTSQKSLLPNREWGFFCSLLSSPLMVGIVPDVAASEEMHISHVLHLCPTSMSYTTICHWHFSEWWGALLVTWHLLILVTISFSLDSLRILYFFFLYSSSLEVFVLHLYRKIHLFTCIAKWAVYV